MAENVTTLFEKWQKQQQEHPEWTPSLEDLVYFIHGSGSDRDRLYSVEQLRNFLQTVITALTGLKNISISYSSNNDGITITGSHGSIYIEGGNPPRIRFVSDQGGPRSELTHNGLKLVKSSGTESEKQALQSLDNDGNFTANKSYVLESSQDTQRQFKVKSSGGGAFSYMDYNKVVVIDGSGNTVVEKNGVTITKKVGTGSASVSMSMSDTNDSVTFDKPVKLEEYLVGSYWKIRSQSAQSGATFVIAKKNGDNWDDKFLFDATGNTLTLRDAQLKVGGLFTSSNVVLAKEDVALTQTPYSSYPAGTELTIVNDKDSGSITVTYGNGQTENILSHAARKYVKCSTAGWGRIFAYDPTAEHP